MKRLNPALFSSVKMDWATPQAFFDALDAEFHFTLDPCASPGNAKCGKFYTIADNGLEQDWAGETVFCNPPYGREIGKWVKKAYEEARGGGTLLYCLFPLERIQPIFTITYTRKQKSASFAGGFASQTTKGTPAIPRPSLLW